MKIPAAAADANAVIGLAKGGVFHLLAQRYGVLYVPPSVTAEVVGKGAGRPGASELAHALGNWVQEVAPAASAGGPVSPGLSAADRELLAIAREKGVDHLLSSDDGVYREAMRLGMICLSTLEVVVHLKRHGLIPHVRPVLDAMLKAGHGVPPALYEQVLRSVGEWPTP